MSDIVTLIGLDAASDRRNFGYAIGTCRSGVGEVASAGCLASDAHTCTGLDHVVEAIGTAIDRGSVLIAIDAPLGWPLALSTELHRHHAGESIGAPKEAMFRRATEVRLRRPEYGRHQPLEVAADRIARAAYEALKVLGELRDRTGLALPLAWSPAFTGAAVIEVYPAATLKAHALPSRGYKKPEQIAVRRDIAMRIADRFRALDAHCEASANAFDAALCVLAATDFLSGDCEPPDEHNEAIARREGWIWVRRGDT